MSEFQIKTLTQRARKFFIAAFIAAAILIPIKVCMSYGLSWEDSILYTTIAYTSVLLVICGGFAFFFWAFDAIYDWKLRGALTEEEYTELIDFVNNLDFCASVQWGVAKGEGDTDEIKAILEKAKKVPLPPKIFQNFS